MRRSELPNVAIRSNLRRCIAATALTLVLAMAVPTPALAWSNGPSYGAGFGTHDWVMYEATSIARARGVTWLDEGIALNATDDPDTVLHDTWYHVYDVWGSTWGDSPARVAECYASAVSARKAGDIAGASYQVGLLSHYYADTCNPLHTDGSTAEDGMHSSYENAVDDLTTSPGVPGGWATDDGFVRVTDPAGLTQNAAAAAHEQYAALVNGYLSGGLPGVQSITKSSLNRSANGIADLLVSITLDSGKPFVPAPNAVYRFYNTSSGTHFYTPSETEARMVIARWPLLFTYEGIAYFVKPENNDQTLYRFYNRRNGSHFYTASEIEKANVIANLSATYNYDGPSYRVSTSGAPGKPPVYRFYNKRNGSHFYTASNAEKASVIANLSIVYRYEGIAFWLGQ